MTSRQITRALAIADQYRLGAVRANEDKLSAACGKIADPVVRQALAKLVRTDPGYGSGRLSDAHMEALGQRADDKVAAAREQRRSSAIRAWRPMPAPTGSHSPRLPASRWKACRAAC